MCKSNARRIQVRATCGSSRRASESARARLFWAIPSLILRVTFGHTTACRSSDPFRHEMFRPLFRRSAPSPPVLGCSRAMAGVDAESSEVVQEIPHLIFSLASYTARAPHQFSEHHVLRQSHILHARHKSRKHRIRLPREVASMLSLPVLISVSRQEIGWLARLCFRQPIQRVKKLWWARRQRVVVARARARRDAAVQHFLEYLGS